MKDDLISRQAAIEALKKISFSHWFECGEYLSEDTREIEIINSNKALEAIEALPSAQPERKTGHWIKTARWGRVYYCDQCRNYLDFDGVNVGRGSTNFCPNCGAKMDEEKKQ